MVSVCNIDNKTQKQGQIGERNNNRNFVALGRVAKPCLIKNPDERNKIKILLRLMPMCAIMISQQVIRKQP